MLYKSPIGRTAGEDRRKLAIDNVKIFTTDPACRRPDAHLSCARQKSGRSHLTSGRPGWPSSMPHIMPLRMSLPRLCAHI
jgi:hypothetical protein